MADRRDARAAMDVHADVALLRHLRLARMQAHAHADGRRGQGSLALGRGRGRIGGAREGDEERVALGVHLDAVVGAERLAQEPPVLGQQVGVGVAVHAEEAGRALDVREEECDRAGGERGHAATSIARDVQVGNTPIGCRAAARPGDDRGGRAGQVDAHPAGQRGRRDAGARAHGRRHAARSLGARWRGQRGRRAAGDLAERGADGPADRRRRELAGRQPGRRACARRQRAARGLGRRPGGGQRRPDRGLVVGGRLDLVEPHADHRRGFGRVRLGHRRGGRPGRSHCGSAGRRRARHKPRPRR